LFGCEVGLSDHTRGIGVAIAAVSLGATVIEKHFTLNRSDGGVDSAFSMEPSELSMLVTECEQARLALGTVMYGPTNAELGSLKFRRSIYIVEDVQEGDTLTAQNIKTIRPGDGLPPKYYDYLLGKKVSCSAKRGEPVTWDLLLGKS
jgi:N-acetylneuraminate synthase